MDIFYMNLKADGSLLSLPDKTKFFFKNNSKTVGNYSEIWDMDGLQK